MYPNGTVLTRRAPKGNALDKVSVVGASPIRQASVGEWAGAAGDLAIVNPIGNENFNSPEIIPLQFLAENYDIEFEPDLAPTHVESARPARPTRQLSPEEQFRAAARQPENQIKSVRGRTKIGTSE